VFIASAIVICSLGHGLRTFAAVPRSTPFCIPSGSLNRVPASAGVIKGRNVTSAWWQVTLCDPIWHVSSRSGVALFHCEFANCYTRILYINFTSTRHADHRN